MIECIVYLALTYLIASIPTGPILSSLYADTDVTQHGSGNIGATNVHRVLGPRFGVATLAGDLIKGFVPVWVAPLATDVGWFPALVGLVAFIGHCWPAYLEFRGGKGVATVAGVLLALSPLLTLFAAIVWMATFLTLKRSSVAALAAAASIPILMIALLPEQLWAGAILAVGLIQRHRENIARMMSGNEPPTSNR
jgi:glycerol-3-phosphate acyltransferase PlsY